MIDVVKEVGMFKPIDLTHIPEIYKPATEQMRTSFILYNKALHEVHYGHEDIAKNYLRKAVTIFPEFYDAVMVLGILVFANGDRIGAVRIFNSVKDVERRAESIGLLDHLVEEAEKPSSGRTIKTKMNSEGQGNKKLANVMGSGQRENAPVQQREAKYSKGQIFERQSGYYEPQPQRKHSVTSVRPAYGSYRKVSEKAEIEESIEQHQTQNAQQRQPAEAVLFKNQAKDMHDIRLLNKYLLIIMGILLAFLIVISTMLVNRTSEVKQLEEKNEELYQIVEKIQSNQNT